jgi:hypothetical protein
VLGLSKGNFEMLALFVRHGIAASRCRGFSR